MPAFSRQGFVALLEAVDRLLQRVLRDCWWLSAIVATVVFLPLLLLTHLPGWYDRVALAILAPACGVAALGWIVAIKESLNRWPGFSLALTIAMPLVVAILARVEARKVVAQSFGVAPEAFPMTLDVLTAVTTLWWIFIGIAIALGLLLAGVAVWQVLAGSGAGKTLLRALAVVLPFSGFTTLPLASSTTILPRLADLARELDGQEHHRCRISPLDPRPVSVTFLSDTQVLAWMPGNTQPIIMACQMR